MNKIKDKLKLVGDLGIVEILKISATHIAGSYIPMISLVDEILKASEDKAEFDDIRTELGKVREDFVKHEEQLAKQEEHLEKHDSEISDLNTMVDSLKSGLSEKLSAKELSQELEKMKSGLNSYIVEEQNKVLQYSHSVDIKMASAIILFFEYFVDDITQHEIGGLLEEIEFGAAGESIEDTFINEISITINFDEYVKKEAIERDCVNPIIKNLEEEDMTNIKVVAYAY